jgi:5-methylcytosine-specific restriction endonuclease McrA
MSGEATGGDAGMDLPASAPGDSPRLSVPRSTLKHMNEIYAANSGSARADLTDAEAVPPRSGVPDELAELEARICELAGHLAAATCRFLLLVADFDARRGWAAWDLPSCAAWLAWKCQIAPGTAREHVRVARALRDLPTIRCAFAAGTMSYAKVRALTRIATPATDGDLAELAGPMTAGQLERFVRAHRQVSAADDQHATAARRVSWRVEDDGSLALSVRLPAAEGAVVLQALRAAADDLDHSHAEPDRADPASAGLADALVDIAGAYLGGKITRADNADLYQVIVHVGPEALTAEPMLAAGPQADVPAGTRPGYPADPRRCHLDDGPALSPATAQRLACAATVTWMLHDHDGTLLDAGRRHRTPPPALRRAVRERDRCRCQFPGCNSRRTDIHHIRPWARGGTTRLSNLILLCEAHHVIVHERGYVIAPAPGGFAVTGPDGTPVPASPRLPRSSGDIAGCHDADIISDTIVPSWNGDRLDLDHAIWVSFANARLAA